MREFGCVDEEGRHVQSATELGEGVVDFDDFSTAALEAVKNPVKS